MEFGKCGIWKMWNLWNLSKYLYSSCNGLLVTKKKHDNNDNENNNTIIEFIDALPLFHSSITLNSTLEIALLQVIYFSRFLFLFRS